MTIMRYRKDNESVLFSKFIYSINQLSQPFYSLFCHGKIITLPLKIK